MATSQMEKREMQILRNKDGECYTTCAYQHNLATDCQECCNGRMERAYQEFAMAEMMYVATNCTIEHQGRSFTSGGAVVTDDRLIAYPDTETTGDLKDWHGNVIGKCRVLSSWRINSWLSDRMFSYECFVNGVRYVGRGCGKGMILKAKRSPRQ